MFFLFFGAAWYHFSKKRWDSEPPVWDDNVEYYVAAFVALIVAGQVGMAIERSE